MLRKLLLGSLLACTMVWSSQAADPLKLDKEKSKITFVGKKTDGKHSGGFKEFTVDAKADMEDPTKSSLAIEITTDSLFSDDEKLTGHLKNPDFFDVRKHPKIKFVSTKIEVAGETEATITGKLTMLGKEIELKVPCKVDASDTGITLEAKFKLDRTKWGMTYGEGKIDKEVEIDATMKFKK